MSQGEIDRYLSRLGRSLRLKAAEREDVAAELRDHLEERLAELTAQGVPHDAAVRRALEEFGDADQLAAEFASISHVRRRRWIMRCTTGGIAALAAALLLALGWWPETPDAPFFGRAEAQSKDKPEAKPRSSKEENNAKTEALLASLRVKAEFKEATLRDVLDYVREVTKAKAGDKPAMQMHLENYHLEQAAIYLDNQVTVELADVRLDMLLELVLRAVGAGYYVDDGIVFVTSKQAVDQRMETRVYNCRDLLMLPRLPGEAGKRAVAPPAAAPGTGPPGAAGLPAGGADPFAGLPRPTGPQEELIEILTMTVKPESWSEQGGPGTIAEYRGLLVVAQSADVHRQIERLLEMLREAAMKEPPPIDAKDK